MAWRGRLGSRLTALVARHFFPLVYYRRTTELMRQRYNGSDFIRKQTLAPSRLCKAHGKEACRAFGPRTQIECDPNLFRHFSSSHPPPFQGLHHVPCAAMACGLAEETMKRLPVHQKYVAFYNCNSIILMLRSHGAKESPGVCSQLTTVSR